MRKTKTIEFNGEPLEVKELLVSDQVDVLMKLMNGFDPHPLDVMTGMKLFPALVVFLSIGKKEADFSLVFTEDELDELYEAVADVNPRLVARLAQLKQQGDSSQTSEPPQSS